MYDDDDYGFWDDSRARSHSVPITRPLGPRSVHATVDLGDPAFAPPRPANYFWRRLGALLSVGIIAAPIALVMRGSDSGPRVTAAASVIVATTAAATTDPPVQLTAATPAPSVVAGTVGAGRLDPATATAATPAIATGGSAAAVATAASTATPATQAQPATAAHSDAVPAPAPDAVGTLPAASAVPQIQTVAAPGTQRPTIAVVETPATARPTCDNKYRVVAGDFWIGVAKKVNVTLTRLLSVNQATVSSPLYPGRSICLPANSSTSTATAPNTTFKPTTKPTTTKPATTLTTKPAAKPTSTTVKAKVTTTTAQPSTTPAAPQVSYSRAEVVQIIRDIWPDDLENQAIMIAARESNLMPGVRNSCCLGLFQIHFSANQRSLASWGITSPNMLFDPRANAYAAYALYLRAGGWGPWGM